MNIPKSETLFKIGIICTIITFLIMNYNIYYLLKQNYILQEQVQTLQYQNLSQEQDLTTLKLKLN